jgi:hypothetical protein
MWERESLLAIPERDRPTVRAVYNGKQYRAIISKNPYGKSAWVRIEQNGKHLAGMSCGWCLVCETLNDPKTSPIEITNESRWFTPACGG